jgi:SAM-dependent methyltransferase
MAFKFVCARCKGILIENDVKAVCSDCKTVFSKINSCIDFAGFENKTCLEREYYEQYHIRSSQYNLERKPRKVTEKMRLYHEQWLDPFFPSGKIILSQLGDLRDKDVLCLGSGSSQREIFFAEQGASVCISDLSLRAILKTYDVVSTTCKDLDIHCHAIDAYHLPLNDSSVDVVYGKSFVHHLEDKTPFPREVFRVLRRNGFCLFLDAAFNPQWQFAKKTIFRPLQKYARRRRPTSPEDLRASAEGGFIEEAVKNSGRTVGFYDYFYIRNEFLSFFWRRGLNKILSGRRRKQFYNLNSKVASLLTYADEKLAKVSRKYYGYMNRLVWGYKKD